MNTSENNSMQQFLNFKLHDEVFGVNVFQVREILEVTKITKVPQTPDYLCGVINLRGSVVPVVDMRIKFGLPVSDITVNTCIIVIEIALDGELSVIGALVDSVQEVIELEKNQIEDPPKIGTRLDTNLIKGMGKHNEEFIILLDIDKIFSTEELMTITSEI